MATIGIYAIRDTLAGMLIGGLHMHRHDAPAIRFFTDVATMPDSGIGRHPNDYELVCLANISDDGTIEQWAVPGLNGDTAYAKLDVRVVLTGAQWAAMQQEGTDRA